MRKCTPNVVDLMISRLPNTYLSFPTFLQCARICACPCNSRPISRAAMIYALARGVGSIRPSALTKPKPHARATPPLVLTENLEHALMLQYNLRYFTSPHRSAPRSHPRPLACKHPPPRTSLSKPHASAGLPCTTERALRTSALQGRRVDGMFRWLRIGRYVSCVGAEVRGRRAAALGGGKRGCAGVRGGYLRTYIRGRDGLGERVYWAGLGWECEGSGDGVAWEA